MSGKDEVTDIEQLIADFEASDLRELQVRHGEFEVFLSKDANAAGIGNTAQTRINAVAAAPVAAATTAEKAAAAPAAASTVDPGDLPDSAVLIRTPYLGTFYRSPKPGAPAYVEVGTAVSVETEMCLVEVMKLFTSVRAGLDGKVHAILADDGAMVQADQPLFVVVPA